MRKLIPMGLLLSAMLCYAQAPLSPAVKGYVSVDAPVVALAHVRVIDGTGAAAREDQTVVISGGRILSAGPAASTPPPAGAKVMDLDGYTVIPGLVGMHDHLFYPGGNGYNELDFSAPRLYLAGGVTTIRTTGSIEPYTDLSLKRLIDASRAPGPRIFVTGPYLEGPGAFTAQMHQLSDANDARRTVDYWIAEGVNNFKAYMNITRAELSAAIEDAHQHKLKVTGHLCSIGFREAAQLGIDDLEHGLVVDTEFTPGKQPDQCPPGSQTDASIAKLDLHGAPAQEMIRDLVARHVAVTSTLPVFETFVPNRPEMAVTAPGSSRPVPSAYMQKVLDSMLPDARIAYLRRRATVAGTPNSLWPQLFRQEMDFEREFAKAGGLLLAGLDPTGYGGVVPGFGDQREVELLVEAGFTPVEAIHIATANGAQFLGESDHFGVIAPGKAADLVVIHGNPAANIADIEKVEIVFKEGIGYDPAKLIESTRGMVGLH